MFATGNYRRHAGIHYTATTGILYSATAGILYSATAGTITPLSSAHYKTYFVSRSSLHYGLIYATSVPSIDRCGIRKTVHTTTASG